MQNAATITKLRVLLVEDDTSSARLIAEGPSESRIFEVVNVRRLSEAVLAVQQSTFDAALLDLLLPDGRGLETLQRLSAAAPSLPIVVFTGVNDETIAREAVRIGAEEYLIKGQADGNAVRRALEYALDRKRLRQALNESERRYRELVDKNHGSTEESPHQLSLTDELTGLYNRRGFLAVSEQQLKVAQRTKREMSLFFVDLDGMKQINDRLGRALGDQALIDAATILKKTFRDSDIIARLGGNEFAVLILECNAAGARIASERMQRHLVNHNTGATRPYSLAFSAGAVHYDPSSNVTLEQLVASADTAMYEQRKRKRKL